MVKLIDVYPDEYPADAKMGGYQLAVSMDILRGRYRKSFETPEPVAPAPRGRTPRTPPSVRPPRCAR